MDIIVSFSRKWWFSIVVWLFTRGYFHHSNPWNHHFPIVFLCFRHGPPWNSPLFQEALRFLMTFSAEEGRPGEAEAFAMRLLDTSGPEKVRGAKRWGEEGLLVVGWWFCDENGEWWFLMDSVRIMIGDYDIWYVGIMISTNIYIYIYIHMLGIMIYNPM